MLKKITLKILLVLPIALFSISVISLNIYWLSRPLSISKTLINFYSGDRLRPEKTNAAIQISRFVDGQSNAGGLNLIDLNGQKLSESEISHLEDVKGLFSMITTIGITTFFTALFLVVLLCLKFSKKMLFDFLLATGVFLFLTVVVIAFFATNNFDNLFSFLHSPFFAENTWIFSEKSILITLFPLSFWQLTAQKLFAYKIFESLSLVAVSLIIKKTAKF
jgi:integral membrane protein (TIGR01906 family)